MKNEMTFILLIIWLVDFNIFMYMINMLKNNRTFHNFGPLYGKMILLVNAQCLFLNMCV